MNQEIYIIKQGEHYKIGYSKSPMGRMGKLQIGSPVELQMIYRCPGTRADEKSLHRILDYWRVNGEWFALPSIIVKKILSLKWHGNAFDCYLDIGMAVAKAKQGIDEEETNVNLFERFSPFKKAEEAESFNDYLARTGGLKPLVRRYEEPLQAEDNQAD